jgi:hypothetical protein
MQTKLIVQRGHEHLAVRAGDTVTTEDGEVLYLMGLSDFFKMPDRPGHTGAEGDVWRVGDQLHTFFGGVERALSVTGPTGPSVTGPTGAASEITGPTGPGTPGPTGPASEVTGPTGADVTGPTGPASEITGPTGPAAIGPTGPEVTGPAGPTGPTGVGSSFTQACRVYQTVADSISSAWTDVLAFGAESFDTDSMHDNVTNNSRITFTTAGRYCVGGQLRLANNTVIGLAIRVDGTTVIASSKQGNSGSPEIVAASTIYEFAVGQYIELVGYAGSTSNSSGDGETSLWAYRIG